MDTLFVDDTANEFRPLPQTSNSRNNSDSEDHQDENGSDVAVKSAEESKLSKNSDVKVIMSDVSESGQNHSTQQSLNMETSGLRVRSHKAENGDKTASTDVHITSANTSQSSIPQKNQTNLSEDRLEKTDSLSRKVNRALAQNVTTPLSLSALDSIEVKSVSSTNSSKFALESERFQQSSLWQFVKRYIPESEQHKVKTKMVTDLSGQSTDLSSMSSNNSNLHGKNLKVNASGKSVLSEQRFNDGLVYSPVGSHKSSTPDHSFISGWKYTRDSEFINGNIRVAESDSDQKTNSSRDLKTSKGPSEQSSQLSHSADELSERVRKLLRQIDNSLEEKSNTDDTKEHPIVIPKLKGLEEVSGHVEHLELNTSQVTGTPRSIEDLTSDERFGSFMPNHSPNKPFSQLQRPIIPEEDEENNEFHETFESSLEEGEIREDSLPYILEARQPIDNRIIRDQIKDELRTSRLREELEMEQIEVRLQLDNENDTHNTQSTSGLKSDDAIPPDFPDHAFGSRDTTLEKNKSSTKLYYKAPKEPVVKEAWRQVTPQPTPDTTIIEPVHPPSQALHKSVRVVDATTAPPSHIASVIIQEDKTLLDSIRVVNDTQCSTSSSTIEWYPRNMKEFKALPKEQKIDFLKKLKAASKRRRSESISSSAASSKTALSTTTEEKMTQKIITAIDSNVRKTIQAEIQKFKNTIPDTQRPAGNPAKRPITEGDKENEPIHTKPSAKASASLRSPSQLTLHDIEDEIKEYKSKERITEKVEEEKKELKKNCAFMVSFGTQVEEQNINVEIRQLHRKTHKVNSHFVFLSFSNRQHFRILTRPLVKPAMVLKQ